MKSVRLCVLLVITLCTACSAEPTTSDDSSIEDGVDMQPADMSADRDLPVTCCAADMPPDQRDEQEDMRVDLEDMALDAEDASGDMRVDLEDMDTSDMMDMPAEDMAPTRDTIPVVVGLGWTGLTMVSIDEGRTWCQTGLMSDDHDDLFRGGGYHDGLWVGGHAGRANRGAIITSTNGYTWTALHKTNTEDTLPDNPTNQWYAGSAHQNGQWIAAGGCGRWATSPDGITWTEQPRFVEGCLHIRAIAAGGGEFVVADDDSRWWKSTDGQTWTRMDGERSKNVVWDGQAFSEDAKFRGRGSCLWSEGFGDSSKVMRSDSESCDNGVEVSRPGHKPTVFLYGDAPATEYEQGALPADLAQCLGISSP